MNVSEMVSQLEEQGLTVRIRHERATDEDVAEARSFSKDLWPLPTTPKHEIEGTISPFGGKTVATILNGQTVLVEGTAFCSPFDQFKKRVGSIKALGRAFGDLQRLT